MRIVHAHGRTFHVGGRKKSDPAQKKKVALHLKKYLRLNALPLPPEDFDYSLKAPRSSASMFKNDMLGCCVISEKFHEEGCKTGNAGTEFVATDAQVVALYSAITNYVPGDPSTDNGTDPVSAIQYLMEHGLADGTKPLGYLIVDPSDHALVKTVVWLFEGGEVAIDLPDAYVNPFPSGNGFVWDVAGPPVASNGHDFMICGFDANGNARILTWGMKGLFTPAAVAKYCADSAGGELLIVLYPSMIGKGMSKAPNGVDWAALVADFNALGGNVPAPAPAPPPPVPAPPPAPAPVPPKPTPPVPTVGLKAAVDAVNTALRGSSPRALITRESAQSLATKALNALPRT